MVKVFVDTNYFIGLVNRSVETDIEIIDEHQCFISALSCHILFYVNKVKVPDPKLNSFINDFNLIQLSLDVLNRALIGPTSDLEDNIQLHSSIEGDCNFFLTKDKDLLKLKFFGKMRIIDKI